MKDIVLVAQAKSADEKASDVRAEKMVPCVVYGKKTESMAIKIDSSSLLKTYRKAGESHIITLDIDGKKIDVLVHQFQKHPVTGDFIHVDFLAVTKGEKVTTNISLVFTGESAAIKEGAVLQEVLKDLEVKVLPKDLVDSFDVDLSKLANIWDSIRVSDLGIDSKKFEITQSEDEVVVIASEPKKQAEPTEEVAEGEAPTEGTAE